MSLRGLYQLIRYRPFLIDSAFPEAGFQHGWHFDPSAKLRINFFCSGLHCVSIFQRFCPFLSADALARWAEVFIGLVGMVIDMLCQVAVIRPGVQ